MCELRLITDVLFVLYQMLNVAIEGVFSISTDICEQHCVCVLYVCMCRLYRTAAKHTNTKANRKSAREMKCRQVKQHIDFTHHLCNTA